MQAIACSGAPVRAAAPRRRPDFRAHASCSGSPLERRTVEEQASSAVSKRALLALGAGLASAGLVVDRQAQASSAVSKRPLLALASWPAGPCPCVR